MKRIITLAAIVAALTGCTVDNTAARAPTFSAHTAKPVAEVSECVANQLLQTWPTAGINQRRDGTLHAVLTRNSIIYGMVDVKQDGTGALFEYRFTGWVGSDGNLAPFKECL
ncbi:TPA: lipoprotein [Enterobacter hormaechei subsp. steigerwaltii]|nr:lipoprotein [Enterobacter hormaechei subsp. steigerwaltii]